MASAEKRSALDDSRDGIIMCPQCKRNYEQEEADANEYYYQYVDEDVRRSRGESPRL